MDAANRNSCFPGDSALGRDAAVAPKKRQQMGVLLLAPQDSSINISRIQSPKGECQDYQASSLAEACLLLVEHKFHMVFLLPGGLISNDEVSLSILLRLADGASVLVFGETGVPSAPLVIRADGTPAALELPTCKMAGRHTDFSAVPRHFIVVGPVTGYRASRLIAVGHKPLKLSLTQAGILWLLLEAPQNRCTLAQLIEAMPNPGLNKAHNTLRVHIHRLRSRLNAQGASGILVSGSGSYWLQWPPAVARSVRHPRPTAHRNIKEISIVNENGLRR